jgi:outer membrane protein assembly factor BamE (lipoprotein component of BamABCDE complex)
MKCYWLVFSSVLLGGCMASNGLQYLAEADTNAYHLARVRKGMDERRVLCIMHKPYSSETYTFAGVVYVVWFYVTKPTGLDQTRMVPQNLTPLTFKNGVLVGTGYSWYYYAMDGEAAEYAQENPPPPKPKSQEVEDAEFEKTLNTYSDKTVIKKPVAPPIAVQPTPEPVANTSSRSFLRPWKKSTPVAATTPKLFSKIQLGMSEAEVKKQIGSPTQFETFTIRDDVYDIWFYDQAPLTFKNEVLVGKTSDDYKRIKDDQDRDDGYNRDAERMEEDESEQNFNYW